MQLPSLCTISDNRILYSSEFGDIDRIAVRSFHLSAGGDRYPLISYQVFNISTFFYHSVLHEDTVLDFGAFLNLHTTEENGIFYLTLDDTAISSHDVAFTFAPVI